MVRIPGGKFLMGSPEDESERLETEGPQHLVEVPAFFMGRYPVTQEQWRVVSGLEQVKRFLKIDPFHFKGSNRPVEQASWFDVVEFCSRLSCFSGKQYHLPSESQWEYACRAGSTTPFHFGATLNSEISNYWAEDTYDAGPEVEFRGQTTDVGEFPANAFGLYDMHGNVGEWCQDDSHATYDDALADGSAWRNDNAHTPLQGVWRGGSWLDYSRNCRSAYRGSFNLDDQYFNLGFRLVCSAPMI